MHTLNRLTAVLATVLLGLMAGFFFAFAVDVAPAMTRSTAEVLRRVKDKGPPTGVREGII